MNLDLRTISMQLVELQQFLQDYGIDRALTAELLDEWITLEDEILTMNKEPARSLDCLRRKQKIGQMKLLREFLS